MVIAVTMASACSSGTVRAPANSAQFGDGLSRATADFRAQTTAIKADGRTALATSDQTKVLGVYESLRDATRDAASGYHELTPPSSLSSSYESLLQSIDGQVAALDEVVRAAKKRDSKTLADALRRYASLLSQYAADLARLESPARTS